MAKADVISPHKFPSILHLQTTIDPDSEINSATKDQKVRAKGTKGKARS